MIFPNRFIRTQGAERMLSQNIPAEDATALGTAIAAYKRCDFDDAFNRFSRLAGEGDADAKTWLGAMYANGEGVEPSLARAFKLYLDGARAGVTLAQTNVGAMLAMGQGIMQDIPAGAGWLEKAAESGDAFAQYNLATLLSKGDGIELDQAAAARWYRAAAETGHYPSQARLGFMYVNGLGVEKNRVEGFLWLSLAAQHGVGAALTALEAIVSQMSADEKRAGTAAVERWRNRTAETSRHARLNPLPG